MSVQPPVPGRNIILGFLALAIVWGLLGSLDQKNNPYGGFGWNVDEGVRRVDADGPAAQAGLQVGDRILSIGGVATDDWRARRRQPRPLIGETRDFLVDRTDEATGTTTTETLPVTYAPPPTSSIADWLPGLAIGLLFLLCGAVVYLRAPNRPTLLFCALCFCLGAVMMPGPYLASFAFRMVQQVLVMVGFLGGFVLMLHFLLSFPKRKQFLERPDAWKWVYIPGAGAAALGIILDFLGSGSGILANVFTIVMGIIVLAYMVSSIAAMVHTYVRTTPAERTEFGLTYVLWGVIGGLLPIGLMLVVSLFGGHPPGGEYYFLALLLIPVAFAVALLKAGRSSVAVS
jgi:hypothetical protein